MQSTTRGSLIQCLTKCLTIFKEGGHEYLYIFHNPRGKYYMIVSENELNVFDKNHEEGHIRLVMRITEGELCSIIRWIKKLPQLSLNFDTKENHPL